LITLAAATSQADYNKLRAGALARMQDNQLLAACAFLVGRTPSMALTPQHILASRRFLPHKS
jgi:hypothetical protein